MTGTRPIAALAIASVLAVGASIEYYGLIEKLTVQSGDAYRIEAQLSRFRPALARTAGHAKLGYFNDRQEGSAGARAAVAAAQFAMAPQILVEDESRQDILYWIGDFMAPRDFSRIGEVKGLEMVADLGTGVVLYRRGAQER